MGILYIIINAIIELMTLLILWLGCTSLPQGNIQALKYKTACLNTDTRWLSQYVTSVEVSVILEELTLPLVSFDDNNPGLLPSEDARGSRVSPTNVTGLPSLEDMRVRVSPTNMAAFCSLSYVYVHCPEEDSANLVEIVAASSPFLLIEKFAKNMTPHETVTAKNITTVCLSDC